MEFQYFLDQSVLSGITVREYQTNLTSTPGSVLWEVGGSSEDTNLTCIFTFTKQSSTGQLLFSNLSSPNYISYSGLVVGIDDSNHLFVESRQDREVHRFTNTNLSTKNCIALKRAGTNITVNKYDLLSRKFESTETKSFSPGAALDGFSDVVIGGLDNTSLFAGYNSGSYAGSNSIGFFSGTMDQFVYIEGAVEDSYLLDLMSGFLPLTKTPTTSSSYTLLTQSYRFPDGLYSNDYGFLTDYFSSGNTDILTGNLGTGKWYGNGVGQVEDLGFGVDVAYGTGIHACLGTGSYFSKTYTTTGIGVLTPFTDTIRMVKSSTAATISHNMVFTQSGRTYNVDHDAVYSLVSSTSYSWSEDLTYYTGFKMEGVVSDQTLVMALATDEDVAPSGYNLEGFYDNSENSFYIDKFAPGLPYHNGRRYTSNYGMDGYYIDFTGVTELSTDYVIGDNSSTPTLLHSGVSGWATGLFYPTSSQAYSGVYPTGRMRRRDYKETCSHHLYHAVPVQGSGSSFFFSL